MKCIVKVFLKSFLEVQVMLLHNFLLASLAKMHVDIQILTVTLTHADNF